MAAELLWLWSIKVGFCRWKHKLGRKITYVYKPLLADYQGPNIHYTLVFIIIIIIWLMAVITKYIMTFRAKMFSDMFCKHKAAMIEWSQQHTALGITG